MSSEIEIRARAHAIWLTEGKPSGKELEHWLRAKTELELHVAVKAAPEKKAAVKKVAAPKKPAAVKLAVVKTPVAKLAIVKPAVAKLSVVKTDMAGAKKPAAKKTNTPA